MDKGLLSQLDGRIVYSYKIHKRKTKTICIILKVKVEIKISQRVYPEEIQKVKENYYRIEKIVKTTTLKNGVKGYTL